MWGMNFGRIFDDRSYVTKRADDYVRWVLTVDFECILQLANQNLAFVE